MERNDFPAGDPGQGSTGGPGAGGGIGNTGNTVGTQGYGAGTGAATGGANIDTGRTTPGGSESPSFADRAR